MTSPSPKRRWHQFSLKSLFVLLTVLCVGPLSYVARERELCRRGMEAATSINALGKVDGWRDRLMFGKSVYDPKFHRPDWMKAILGDNSFRHIVGVRLRGNLVTDAYAATLIWLPNLEEVLLEDSQITDEALLPISRLKNLQRLRLDGTRVTDDGLSTMFALPKLRGLGIGDTSITDQGILHLKKLKSLKYLEVQRSKVTEEGIRELKQELPGLKVTFKDFWEGGEYWRPEAPAK